MSLAGRPLYQRRYKRSLHGLASVKEDVAACATHAALEFIRARLGASWRPDVVAVPFAGSGTLGFEALLALDGVPPSLFFGPLSADAFVCCPAAAIAFARRRLVTQWLERAAAAPVAALRFVELDARQSASLADNVAGFNEVLVAAGGAPIVADVQSGDAGALAARTLAADRPFLALNPPYGDRLTRGADAKEAIAAVAAAAVVARASGFALLPDPLAQRFARAVAPAATLLRAFSHGGKTVQLVLFCATP